MFVIKSYIIFSILKYASGTNESDYCRTEIDELKRDNAELKSRLAILEDHLIKRTDKKQGTSYVTGYSKRE